MASPSLGPRLPLEILGIVVSLVSETRTLHCLSICSRAFALFTEPILYAVVRFEPDARGVKLARTLVRSRRKSKFVFSVTASLIDRDHPLLPSTVKLIVRAIAGCSNLQNLSTCWGLRFSWAIRLMLHLVPAFRLRQFHTLLQWDLPVSDFLESQPTLKELGIVQPARLAAGNTASLSSSALPLLSTFMGRLPQALEVVPGRPITSIVLHGAVTLGDLASALPKLALTSAPMEMISLQAEELSGDLLTLLSAYMPTLVRLEIRIVRSSMVAYSSLASEPVCQAMGLMSRLNYFRLRLRCPLLFSDSFFHSQRDVVLEWNTHCRTLKKVVFESSSENKIIEWSYDEEAMDWVCSLDE